MTFDDLVILILFIFVIYIVFFRQFVLRRRKFKCLRCGRCCSLKVKLSKEDIKRLEKAGKKDFIEGKHWLKRINKYCQFLEIKNGKSRCLVYNSRPEICRNWPLKRFTTDVRCSNYNGKLI
jgi:Fe-S-cluster containining protein